MRVFCDGEGAIRTSHADEFPRALGDELLLEEAGAAALYAVELGVDLVGAVEGDVEDGVFGEAVEGDRGEARFDDDLARLVARGDEADGGVVGDFLDGLDDVDDGGAGADADVGGGRVEVVLDGLLGGGALRRLDGGVGHGGGGGRGGAGGAGVRGRGEGSGGATRGETARGRIAGGGAGGRESRGRGQLRGAAWQLGGRGMTDAAGLLSDAKKVTIRAAHGMDWQQKKGGAAAED